MIDARVFGPYVTAAKAILELHNAIYKGDYEIHDAIYTSKDPTKTIAEEFLRLRSVPKNIWNEKPFIVAIKNTTLKAVGKNSTIPLKIEFDTEAEARKYISENLSDRYIFDYEFNRTGSQYFMPNGDGVDLENIEGHSSIEFKSPTENGIEALLRTFNIDRRDVIKGPSVIAIKELLFPPGKSIS